MRIEQFDIQLCNQINQENLFDLVTIQKQNNENIHIINDFIFKRKIKIDRSESSILFVCLLQYNGESIVVGIITIEPNSPQTHYPMSPGEINENVEFHEFHTFALCKQLFSLKLLQYIFAKIIKTFVESDEKENSVFWFSNKYKNSFFSKMLNNRVINENTFSPYYFHNESTYFAEELLKQLEIQKDKARKHGLQ